MRPQNACNKCESSRNVCDSSCEVNEFISQNVVRGSCANCERDLIGTFLLCNLQLVLTVLLS